MASPRGTGSWETLDSGIETRDVLENGERKGVMQAILGKKVKAEDVAWENGLPYAERLKLAQERRAMLGGRAAAGGMMLQY